MCVIMECFGAECFLVCVFCFWVCVCVCLCLVCVCDEWVSVVSVCGCV